MTGSIKRFLFVTPPGYGHIFPLVPLAWAIRSLGHEVLVATCGVSVAASTRSGLPTVNVAPGVNLPAVFERFRDDYQNMFYDPDLPETKRKPVEVSDQTIFTVLGDIMLDGLVALAGNWRPDVIIYTPYAAAAPIAASRFGIPAVFLGIALAYTPKAMFEGTYARMADSCARHGVRRIDQPSLWIDMAPPSLRRAPSGGTPMRPVPYNGADFYEPRKFKDTAPVQIAVTLGTVVPVAEGLAPLKWLIDAARGVQAEFIIALGVPQAGALGELPANVRACSWISLDRLVADSTAVIHHGGPGTMFTALDAGLPQLILPRASDQFYNAEALRRRGVALVPGEANLGAQLVNELITDRGLRSAAEEVRNEIRSMPAPATVAAQVAALAA